MRSYQKSSSLYLIVIITWLLTVYFTLEYLLIIPQQAYQKSGLLIYTIYFVIILILYFWFNAIKDIVYTMFYWLLPRRHVHLNIDKFENTGDHPDVDLIYVVCDDFDPISLDKSLKQDYPEDKMHVYILDDSKMKINQIIIDDFAKYRHIKVIRRNNHRGFKAGNINHWLRLCLDPSPYFVILDSDEIIPPDFITPPPPTHPTYSTLGCLNNC